jgi:hypothetical protein
MATSTSTPLTVAQGHGIRPKIMAATPDILKEACAGPRNYDGNPGFTLAQGQ